MAASTAELRRSLSSDEGQARTKALASLVGVMIVAAVAALILVVVNRGGMSHPTAGAQPSASDVGRQSTPSTSVPTSSPATGPATTSAAPATTPPPAAKTATRPTSKAHAAPAKNAGTNAMSKKPVTYTVKRGDNLTVIAAWFHQHGYGQLYERNRSVIGNNPDLIFPGEKITISHGAMTLH